ncbi:GtrA family protein [Paenibacillus sp. NPDC056579]|uniref:GtrA family protein n=1 Tax=Paenibacillus sp. NPDC056579 TaxID=3345871 RepID=UPI00368361EE
MIRFSIIGSLNSGIDIAVFAALTSISIHYLLAQGIAFFCGVINSYACNRSWTFQQQGKADHREFVKFLVLNGVVLLFTSWVLSILYTQAGLPLLVSKLASAMAGALINFTGSRWWVFRLSQD